MIINISIFILIITFVFILWSDYSVGNILFRPNSLGNNTMNMNSLFSFIIDPFYRSTLWTWETLDINYPFILGYSLIIYFLV